MNFVRRSLTLVSLVMVSGLASAQAFPDRELSGVIMWGAGGATDVVARAVASPEVQDANDAVASWITANCSAN